MIPATLPAAAADGGEPIPGLRLPDGAAFAAVIDALPIGNPPAPEPDAAAVVEPTAAGPAPATAIPVHPDPARTEMPAIVADARALIAQLSPPPGIVPAAVPIAADPAAPVPAASGLARPTAPETRVEIAGSVPPRRIRQDSVAPRAQSGAPAATQSAPDNADPAAPLMLAANEGIPAAGPRLREGVAPEHAPTAAAPAAAVDDLAEDAKSQDADDAEPPADSADVPAPATVAPAMASIVPLGPPPTGITPTTPTNDPDQPRRPRQSEDPVATVARGARLHGGEAPAEGAAAPRTAKLARHVGSDAPPAPNVAAKAVETAIAAMTPARPAEAAAPAGAISAALPPGDVAITRHLDLAHDAQWLDRLAQDIARSADRGANLRFALAPEHLGRLTVDLAAGADGTAVRLVTESEQAHRIIADAQPRLVAEARAQGLRISETHVDLDQRAGGEQPQPRGDGQTGQDRPRPAVLWTELPQRGARAADQRAPRARDLYA